MGATKSYDLDKVLGGEDKYIYAKQGEYSSNILLSNVTTYSLSINGTTYSSLAEPTSEVEFSVGDSILLYEDGTNNSTAYLTSQGILKEITTHNNVSMIINSITVNSTSVDSIVEKDIKNEDVIALTLVSEE